MSLSASSPAPNAAHGNTVYDGSVNAISASGGFVMDRGFTDISLNVQAVPVNVDVTNSVQVLMDVATFNTKLGSFRATTDDFSNNEITISHSEFTAGIGKATQVISVGKYETLYSGFQSYVAAYFGFDGGFSSLFAAASEFSIDTTNTFNGASFKSLLSPVANSGGSEILDLSGSITISNIAELLRYAVDANIFGNRNPLEAGSAVDPSNNADYGVKDMFVAGDLIWVPAGTTITLHLAINTESFAPLNNIGTTNGSGLSSSQSSSFTATNFTMSTTATTALITRTVTAPLLIKLVSAATIAALA